jgi:prepilin-type N-terminal cleavage/methylation domain-containing protein
LRVNSDKGMTLIEVLATILLVSMVVVLIWTGVLISMRYNVAETKKTHLQQEANYIITEIQRIHRYCDSYDLTISRNEISVKNCYLASSNSKTDFTIANTYQYESTPEYIGKLIETKKNDSYINFTLTVRDIKNKKLFVEIPTTISRYKITQ